MSFPHSASGDLPDGLHRSIGFGPQSIEAYPPPRRLTGHIQRKASPEDQNFLVVDDLETQTTYRVDLRILTSFGAQLEHKKYFLEFNQDIQEWIVRIENLSNPTNHLGFLN